MGAQTSAPARNVTAPVQPAGSAAPQPAPEPGAKSAGAVQAEQQVLVHGALLVPSSTVRFVDLDGDVHSLLGRSFLSIPSVVALAQSSKELRRIYGADELWRSICGAEDSALFLKDVPVMVQVVRLLRSDRAVLPLTEDREGPGLVVRGNRLAMVYPAKTFDIVWMNDVYWTMQRSPARIESLFPRYAHLKSVWWFSVSGIVNIAEMGEHCLSLRVAVMERISASTPTQVSLEAEPDSGAEGQSLLEQSDYFAAAKVAVGYGRFCEVPVGRFLVTKPGRFRFTWWNHDGTYKARLAFDGIVIQRG